MKRKMTRTFSTYCVIALSLLLFLEIGVRITEAIVYNGEVGALSSFVELDGEYWKIRPKSIVIQPTRYGDITHTFNSYGYRGPEPSKDPRNCKIVFLGDSITFGLHVNDEAIYPSLIQSALNSRNDPGCQYESINLALFSYHPKDEAQVFETIGLKLKPNLIVLQFYMNDFMTKIEKRQHLSLGQRFSVLKSLAINNSAALLRAQQVIQWLSYALIHDLRRTYFIDSLNIDELKEKAALFRTNQNSQIESFKYIEKIQELAKAANIPILAILTPNEGQLFWKDYDIINKRIAEFFVRKNITFYDPLEEIRKHPESKKLFLDGLHFTPLGHELLAHLLVPRIQKKLGGR